MGHSYYGSTPNLAVSMQIQKHTGTHRQKCQLISGTFVSERAMRHNPLLKRGAEIFSLVLNTKISSVKVIQKSVSLEEIPTLFKKGKTIIISCASPFEHVRNSAKNFYFR